MGELVRFPGAVVDYDFLDDFEWTDELLHAYAARARALAERSSVLDAPPRWPRGVCQDCGSVSKGRLSRRYRVGRFLLCVRHAESRLRVRESLAFLEVQARRRAS